MWVYISYSYNNIVVLYIVCEQACSLHGGDKHSCGRYLISFSILSVECDADIHAVYSLNSLLLYNIGDNDVHSFEREPYKCGGV